MMPRLRAQPLGYSVTGLLFVLASLSAAQWAAPLLRGADTLGLGLVVGSIGAVLLRAPLLENPWRVVPGLCVLVALPFAQSPALSLAIVALAVAALRLGAGPSLGWQFEPLTSMEPFARALLIFTLGASIFHFFVAGYVTHNFDNDAAYYYGAARHIAMTGRLEEAILWHTLNMPERVPHPAFDYWQGMVALLLVPPFWIFGISHVVAARTVVVFFALAGLGLWYLVCRTGLVKHRVVQLVAVVLYAFNPCLVVFRLDTETVCFVHFFMIGGLLSLYHRRLVTTLVFGVCLLLTRADGSLTTAIFWLAALLSARSRREALRVLGAMAVITGLYVLACFWHFGTLGPPGVRQAAYLSEYLDLYRLEPNLLTSAQMLGSRLQLGALYAALQTLYATFGWVPYLTNPAAAIPLFLVGVIRGGDRELRGDTDPAALRTAMAAIVIAVPVGMAWLSPLVFSPGRSLHTLIPVMIVVASIGLDALLVISRSPSLRSVIIESVLLAACFVSLRGGLNIRPWIGVEPLIEEVRYIAPIVGTDTVVTNAPWIVASDTDANAVILPIDSLGAAVEMIERYDADWIFISGTCCAWPAELQRMWSFVAPGPLGRLRLELVRETEHERLLRVVR